MIVLGWRSTEMVRRYAYRRTDGLKRAGISLPHSYEQDPVDRQTSCPFKATPLE